MAPEEGMRAKQRQISAQYKDHFNTKVPCKIKQLEVLEQKVERDPLVVRNWNINPVQFNIPTTLVLPSTQHRHFLYSIVGKGSSLANFFESLRKCACYLLRVCSSGGGQALIYRAHFLERVEGLISIVQVEEPPLTKQVLIIGRRSFNVRTS